MIDKELLRLMRCFPRSFVTERSEIIIHEKTNTYFKVDVEEEKDLKYKVLEWLSRPAHAAQPFNSNKKNAEFHDFLLKGINSFLDTYFSIDDIELIYAELGNGVNRPLTEKFVQSGYDLEILRKEI